MINIDTEKDLAINTQAVYEILDFAMQSAEDNGFINSFVFERAIYLYTAITVYQDRKEEIASLVATSPLVAWYALLEDGTISKLKEEYPKELEFLAENGKYWYEEFTEYAHSARGLLNTIQQFSGDIVKQATEQLNAANTSPLLQETIKIAEDWGMTRNEPGTVIDGESLFE